ncbi:MAG: DUF1499 domain-containing protein [Planctomycetes bacterium]|nr:DUF1499 domain-containing protein [Planctomycetota bacterium]
MKRRGRTWALVGVVGAGAALAAVALQVDDWRRDLTTNHARTAPHATDSRLRPLRTTLDASTVAARVEEVARSLPRWEVVAVERDPGGVTVRLMRTTRLLRFRDDVTVRVAPSGSAWVVTAESRSRVGRGDLGQNPRNLRELLGALRDRLER